MTIKDIVRTFGVDVDKTSELAAFLAQYLPSDKIRSVEKARLYSDGLAVRMPLVGLALARVIPTLDVDGLDVLAGLEVYHVAKWTRAVDVYSSTKPIPSQSAEYAWHHLIEDSIV